jgi:hypothetical protein
MELDFLASPSIFIMEVTNLGRMQEEGKGRKGERKG